MNIIWQGQFCFQISTSQRKNSQTSILIDPNSLNLKKSGFKPDILLFTHHSKLENVTEQTFLIDGPGEYEIKEVFIQGVPTSNNKTTIYSLDSEAMRICHLGNINQKELTSDQLEKIGNVDILMIPVGDVDVISAKEAMRIISQIEPKVIIPMYYRIPKAKVELENLNNFLKIMGRESPDILDKLKISKKDLPKEEAKIVVLKPQC